MPLDGRPAARIHDGAGGEMRSMAAHPDGRQVAFVLRKLGPTPPSQLWVLENVLPAPKKAPK